MRRFFRYLCQIIRHKNNGVEKKLNSIIDINDYRELWQKAIHLCEIEPSKDEAEAFVYKYWDKGESVFEHMDDRTLLLTFVGLVVYEKKFHIKLGSTTPAAFCYSVLMRRARNLDIEFVYDVGDWAADYSDNGYVPMGNYRGYGPRQYYYFWQ